MLFHLIRKHKELQPLVRGAGRLSQERKKGVGAHPQKGGAGRPLPPLQYYPIIVECITDRKYHLIGKRLSKQTTFTAKDTSAGLFIGVIQQDGAYYGIKISAYWEA